MYIHMQQFFKQHNCDYSNCRIDRMLKLTKDGYIDALQFFSLMKPKAFQTNSKPMPDRVHMGVWENKNVINDSGFRYFTNLILGNWKFIHLIPEKSIYRHKCKTISGRLLSLNGTFLFNFQRLDSLFITLILTQYNQIYQIFLILHISTYSNLTLFKLYSTQLYLI